MQEMSNDTRISITLESIHPSQQRLGRRLELLFAFFNLDGESRSELFHSLVGHRRVPLKIICLGSCLQVSGRRCRHRHHRVVLVCFHSVHTNHHDCNQQQPGHQTGNSNPRGRATAAPRRRRGACEGRRGRRRGAMARGRVNRGPGSRSVELVAHQLDGSPLITKPEVVAWFAVCDDLHSCLPDLEGHRLRKCGSVERGSLKTELVANRDVLGIDLVIVRLDHNVLVAGLRHLVRWIVPWAVEEDDRAAERLALGTRAIVGATGELKLEHCRQAAAVRANRAIAIGALVRVGRRGGGFSGQNLCALVNATSGA
eukprot:m.33444 g.33444  ORF g.33444 m.33444 type:complete len:313 (+) comp7190_c0_seq1:156-1094(+)